MNYINANNILFSFFVFCGQKKKSLRLKKLWILKLARFVGLFYITDLIWVFKKKQLGR